MIPRVNLKRYQSHQLYGDRLKCQTLHTRCNNELANSNEAEKAYWKQRVEQKINNPDEVNFNAELLKVVADSVEMKKLLKEIKKARNREVRVLILV